MAKPLKFPKKAPQFQINTDSWEVRDLGGEMGLLMIQVGKEILEITKQPGMELQLVFWEKGGPGDERTTRPYPEAL